MDLKQLDTSKIEKAMYDYLKANNVCSFIMGGRRNASKSEDKMVYCNAPLDVYDDVAIGKTMMRIEIYVKQRSGFKNASVLTDIHDKIVDLLPVTLGNYSFEYNSELSGYDGETGFDYIFINVPVMIFAN